jgi:hypothetical protein
MTPAHKAGEPQQVSRIAEAVAEVGSECYARCAVLEAALVELVALNDMKDRLAKLHAMGHGTDYTDYYRRLPAAWKAARAAITSATRSQG